MVFDSGITAHLIEQVGLEGFQRLLGIFAEQVSEDIVRIRAALQSDDMRAAEVVAHALKSGAATIGAMDLQLMCEQVEAACANGDRIRAQQLMTELKTRGAETLQAVRAMQIGS